MEEFNFKIVEEDFGNLLTTTQNKLERDWTNKYPNELVNSGKFVILNMFKMSIINFYGIVQFCQISEEQKLTLYLNVPTLNRSIVENLFLLVFLLDNFPENNKLLIKNSLRERKEILDFYKAHYSGIPKWDDYLSKEYPALHKYTGVVDAIVGLTQDEKKNMENMKRIPRVSGIVKYLDRRNRPNIRFFNYLDKLHYLQLSHLSHLQPSGLVAIGKLLEKPQKEDIERFIKEQRWIAVTLVMCLMSEIEIHFNYKLKTQLAHLWEIFQNHSEYAQEAYELRYKELLTS